MDMDFVLNIVRLITFMFVIKKINIVMRIFVNILFMKIDVIKLFIFLWMVAIASMLYFLCYNVDYLTKLIHAYISMAMEIVRH